MPEYLSETQPAWRTSAVTDAPNGSGSQTVTCAGGGVDAANVLSGNIQIAGATGNTAINGTWSPTASSSTTVQFSYTGNGAYTGSGLLWSSWHLDDVLPTTWYSNIDSADLFSDGPSTGGTLDPPIQRFWKDRADAGSLTGALDADESIISLWQATSGTFRPRASDYVTKAMNGALFDGAEKSLRFTPTYGADSFAAAGPAAPEIRISRWNETDAVDGQYWDGAAWQDYVDYDNDGWLPIVLSAAGAWETAPTDFLYPACDDDYQELDFDFRGPAPIDSVLTGKWLHLRSMSLDDVPAPPGPGTDTFVDGLARILVNGEPDRIYGGTGTTVTATGAVDLDDSHEQYSGVLVVTATSHVGLLSGGEVGSTPGSTSTIVTARATCKACGERTS